ncbi:TetR family transcriptional regulator [Microbispora sp. RL4-1S]|uniref:TetR family transcriptional regulator n=1 Tax=Microbispora oryzae TaxID=2806554 RepID=A0A940WLL1_9ACTN|nr:TetR family transcriptional regulator [Microbispora oryzae]MBP2703725.1 TetR family transcriptional regulator [Microbispora oryzae]
MNDDRGERAGLRERKKQETRIALSWAAIRLVVERGLDNVRVEDIAAAAGVSPRTFNNYFSSKAEAITARHLDRSRLTAEELRRRPASEPLWEAIRNAVIARLTLGQDAPTGMPDQQWIDGVRLMVREPALQAEFIRAEVEAEAALAAAVAERVGADPVHDMYPRLVAGAVGAAVRIATDHFLRADPPAAFAPLLEDALGQIARGLPAP